MAYIPGIRLMRLPAALIACAPNHFAARPIEMRAALALITDASEVLSRLLTGGHSTVAGRLAGAFRNKEILLPSQFAGTSTGRASDPHSGTQ